MSKKIFSAQDWENVPFENSVPASPTLLPTSSSTSNNKEEEAERISDIHCPDFDFLARRRNAHKQGYRQSCDQ